MNNRVSYQRCSSYGRAHLALLLATLPASLYHPVTKARFVSVAVMTSRNPFLSLSKEKRCFH